MLQLYNTLTNKKEQFKPLKEGKVSMYNCGPTVYSYAHIGNLASYLMADLLRRYLMYKGYRVTQVKNITDVGHLVSDGDEGEDKMLKAARKLKKDPYEIAKYFEHAYKIDEEKLAIMEPEFRPRATEHVNEMIEMVKKLVEDGYAYETADGVYFHVEKFNEYGKLSGNTLDKLEAGSRVEINTEKKHPSDFALWKKCVGDNKNHIMKWSSPWGEGFPGWHIECSAMCRKYLGDQIDIHTGGEDNIFPHHECEIAQSEAFSGKPFAKYWLHKRWIYVDGKKMSKSLGNFYTLKNIEEMGYSPLDFRYLLLSVHYRTKLNFTEKGLEDAKMSREKFHNCIHALEKVTSQSGNVSDVLDHIENARMQFVNALDDDLNTSKALAILIDFIKKINTMIAQEKLPHAGTKPCLDFFAEINSVFGFIEFEKTHESVPENIKLIAEKRVTAKRNKQYQEADSLRDEILAQGFEIRDNPDGTYELRKV